MTEDSLTGIQSWNIVATVYLIFRALTMVLLLAISSTQSYYELKSYWLMKKTPNARSFTLIGITGYSVSRLVWCFLQLFTYKMGFGTYVTHSTTFAAFFLWMAWLFIGCFWLQLLYTFFLDSKKIILGISTKIWRLTWILMGINASYLIGFNLIMRFKIQSSALFYAIFYFVFMGVVGLFFLVNGIILMRRMGKHIIDQQHQFDKKNDKIKDIKKKTKILVWSIVVSLIGLLGRDAIYYLLDIGMEDNLRYLSAFITYLFEMFITITILYAIAQKPRNYFLFKPVNNCGRPSLHYSSSRQNPSSESGIISMNTGSIDGLTTSNNSNEYPLDVIKSKGTNINNEKINNEVINQQDITEEVYSPMSETPPTSSIASSDSSENIDDIAQEI